MMKRVSHALLPLSCTVSLMLSACGGGGGNGAPDNVCATIGGGAAQVVADASNCPTCSSSNEANAIDGDFRSAATLTMPLGSSGTLALRGTAQSGIAFAQGTVAGAFIQDPRPLSGSSLTLTVTTYLNSVQQDSSPVFIRAGASDTSPGTVIETSSGLFYGIHTTLPYDSIELSLQRSTVTADPDFHVFELCTHD